MASADVPEESPQSNWTSIGQDFVNELGDLSLFALQTLGWCLRRRPAPGTLVTSLYTVGVRTAPVVAVTGLFIGMVLVVQSHASYQRLDMSSLMSRSVNLSIVRELGPVLVATMLAGRVGSAMAAELATMRVTEQLDALSCLGVSPIHYLVVPRFLACVLLVPLLTILADFTGMMGGAGMSIYYYRVESFHYWVHAQGSLKPWDLTMGLIKPTFFGAAISLICCHRGMKGTAGAEGVGRAATEAFVISFVVILILDFFIALFLNSLYDYLWTASDLNPL